MPMTERPILFNSEMVRAIMDGKKTQTRRICKLNPIEGDFNKYGKEAMDAVIIQCPYGQPGDRLWVRETWTDDFMLNPSEEDRSKIAYRADGDSIEKFNYKWKPSIHMPRWASRITLEITNVRAERLQDMCVNDCYAEGIVPSDIGSHSDKIFKAVNDMEDLWNKIYGPGAWDKNPWVWVIEFKMA